MPSPLGCYTKLQWFMMRAQHSKSETGTSVKVHDRLYINGQWTAPHSTRVHEIINPATTQVCAVTPLANEADCIQAIDAACEALPKWSQTSTQERSHFITAAADEMQRRADDLADAITMTMGCPRHLCPNLQVLGSIAAFRSYAERAKLMDQVEERNGIHILKEPVGVCTLINPWNYPLSILVGKTAPALAAGCTVIVKPAEQTPLQDFIVAEVFEKIGLPPGVFNLVTGIGPEVGPVLCAHEGVDMVSFTGSTRAGVHISESAAPTIKRVCLELGGKSPLIITEDAELETAVRYGVQDVMMNTGQTCSALTRMLVPESRYEEAVSIAQRVAEENVVGNPLDPTTTMGPLCSEAQKETVVDYIHQGIQEGARLVTGGHHMPPGMTHGAYLPPTIFADVTNQMRIAREEIFGPVLCMIPFKEVDEAVQLANDSVYGLSSAVFAKTTDEALAIARQIRAGQCFVQGAHFTTEAPFGGYKQSGNGREWGDEGLLEYVEVKAVLTH
ncbi:MAG: aldehyde dehydrogenase family protein [Mariniblastus sp.]|nr:aldehyde dehydrogenase family protein [Mariniblastus sp.]